MKNRKRILHNDDKFCRLHNLVDDFLLWIIKYIFFIFQVININLKMKDGNDFSFLKLRDEIIKLSVNPNPQPAREEQKKLKFEPNLNVVRNPSKKLRFYWNSASRKRKKSWNKKIRRASWNHTS